jgi:uncharacterized membrane protein YhaH (DUF805 family)
MLYCPKCGKEVHSIYDDFCMSCGTKIERNLETTKRETVPIIQKDTTLSPSPSNTTQPNVRRSFIPNGRFTRSQYALTYFGCVKIAWASIFLAGALYSVLPQTVADVFAALFGFIILILIYIGFVAHVRRCHDLGYSGWYTLLLIVPLVYLGMFFVLLFSPTKVEGNKWLANG